VGRMHIASFAKFTRFKAFLKTVDVFHRNIISAIASTAS
jgi:hypothetical protein